MKKNTLARLIAGSIAALMILAPTASFAASEDAPADQYVAYDDISSDATSYAWVTPVTPDGAPYSGWANEIDFDLPEYKHNPLEKYSATAQQPVYYAPGEGVGTYAKDQGSWGTCWAFAATGAAESSLLAQGRTFNRGTAATASNLDLSELHTAFFFYNTESDPLGNMQNDITAIVGDTYLTGGGNGMCTSFALMSWKGMGLESDAPYSSITSKFHPVDQALCHKEAAHCRNAYWIDMSDIMLVKEMVVRYGGVAVHFNYNYERYYTQYASFFNEKDYKYNGHEVLIVGWNDNFPRSQFISQMMNGQWIPNGAWIVKNSWGQNWGMQSAGMRGMFNMSYYDYTLRKNPGIVYDFEDRDNLDNNYQYDGTASINSLPIPAAQSDPTKLGSQYVVKASDYERLSAVSFAFKSPNVHYSIQIFKKGEGGMTTAPDDGIPMLDSPIIGTTDYTGYYTVPLNKELVFQRGDVYSVVISIWHESGNAEIFVDKEDYDNDWIHFVNHVEYGESWFAWGQDSAWAELSDFVFPLNTSYTDGYTLRMKAYTDNMAPITYTLTGLTNGGSEYARYNKPFSTKLVTDTVLPETIDVFMSGNLLTAGESYTYNNATGGITINKVNGPVEIVAGVAVHEHTWSEGVITTAPTCGETGIMTYTCTECGETITEAVPATGRHTWDGGVVTTEPTETETGVRTYTCTVCGAAREEEIPVITGDITINKLGSYDVKISGLNAAKAYTVRYATGVYANAGAVKNGVNAGFIQIRNADEATVTLPTAGTHTIAIFCGSEAVYFGTVDITNADIRDHLVASSNELSLKVENLVGASYVKLYRDGAAIMTVAAKNFSTDGLKTWADMIAPASGVYDVRIVYADGGVVEGSVVLTAPETGISTNGRIFTLSGYGANNVSYLRLAKGEITTAAAMKSAPDLRTYGRKYFTGDTAAFAALDAVNGETTTYTVQIGYASGYTEFVTFGITPTVPTVTAASGSIMITNVQSESYCLDWVRCAPGELDSLYAIRHAKGSQVRKAENIVDDTITFAGLSSGTYSLYYLYDGWNLSEGLLTVNVK
ncbi:MAG: hypothetical protein IJT91_08695 [Clostridia bacterium]|nr:hypothetical protein [Clostridia bacterium]